MVEKAFLKERMEKKVILETISLDKNPAAIDIHYISYGKDRSVISSGVKVLDIIAVPHEFALRQNYPNPFNPVTYIDYSVSENDIVSLDVYDVNGRHVNSLFNNRFHLAGDYNYIFNASNLPSGVYILKLESLSHLDYRKVILTK